MCLPNHAQYTVNACTCTMCRSLDKRVLGDVYEQFQVVEAWHMYRGAAPLEHTGMDTI